MCRILPGKDAHILCGMTTAFTSPGILQLRICQLYEERVFCATFPLASCDYPHLCFQRSNTLLVCHSEGDELIWEVLFAGGTRPSQFLEHVQKSCPNVHVIAFAQQPDKQTIAVILQHADDCIIPPISHGHLSKCLQQLASVRDNVRESNPSGYRKGGSRRAILPAGSFPSTPSAFRSFAENGQAWEIGGTPLAVMTWDAAGMADAEFWKGRFWGHLYQSECAADALHGEGDRAAHNAQALLHWRAWSEKCSLVCAANGVHVIKGLADAVRSLSCIIEFVLLRRSILQHLVPSGWRTRVFWGICDKVC